MANNLKILVVDDEPVIRDIFKQYLESQNNYDVVTAQDGLEALDVMQEKKIDCCFTDLSMPRMDGIELIKRIHRMDNTIPVVVMTGYPSMDNVLGTIKSGVVDFLTKPIEMSSVITTINRVMKERSLFVDNILLKEEARKSKKLLKINQELNHKIKEVETINLILRELEQATTSRDLLRILVNLSGKITSCDEAHFCIFSSGMENYEIITSFVRNKNEFSQNDSLIESAVVKKVADSGMPFLIKKTAGTGSAIAVPLKIRSKTFGILYSAIRNGNASFSEKHLYFMNFLLEKASSVIENLALYENIYESLFSTLFAFVETIEARDPYTKQHSVRVSHYAMQIGKAMGCNQEEVEALNISGNLHDIGKIGIPDNILLKPGRLSEEEYDIIKKHPVIGGNIVGHMGMWTNEQTIIRHHHERFDGTGYPDRLGGQEIPFPSRILSVADVYDAVTTDRSYRKKMSQETAVKIIRDSAGKQFDPDIVNAFIDLHRQNMLEA
jgi:putative nucleotidyltransferase with HDIG domain